MKSIGLAIVVAVIVEALVEYGQTIYDMVAEYEYKKAIKQGVAIAVAILFAFELKVTLITWLMSGNFDVTVSPAFDMIISGLFMSRGANYLADFVRMVLRIGTDDGSIWDAWEDEDEEDEVDESEEG